MDHLENRALRFADQKKQIYNYQFNTKKETIKLEWNGKRLVSQEENAISRLSCQRNLLMIGAPSTHCTASYCTGFRKTHKPYKAIIMKYYGATYHWCIIDGPQMIIAEIT